jgi:hypothetical protein
MQSICRPGKYRVCTNDGERFGLWHNRMTGALGDFDCGAPRTQL